MEKIDILSGESPVIVDAQGYLIVLDYLDGGQNTTSDLLYMAFDNSQLDQRFPIRLTPLENALMLLPLSQEVYHDIADLPFLNATVRKEAYRISLAQNSIQIFTTGSSIVLIWCLILLANSSFSRTPEVSAFPDLDLASKIPSERHGDGFCEISARLSKLKTREIARAITDVRVYIEEGDRNSEELRRTGYH